MDLSVTSQSQLRKAEHLSVCLECDVEPDLINTGLNGYQFVHEALPEVNLEDVQTPCELFGREMSVPFIISSMTGGLAKGQLVNRILAEAAQELRIAIGVGSQRVAFADPALVATFQVRDIAPDVPLLANLGAIQLNNGFTVDHCRAAVDMISADALILHLNPLQESVQEEGNTNFAGLVKKIEAVCASMEVPVVVKEVGQGISERTARLLVDAGVAAIDTAGAGGTSWALVESLRAHNGKAEIGASFSNWGISTAESIRMARRAAPDIALIASGGLRSGLDAAKSIALGADFAAFGLPLLRAAADGSASVVHLLRRYTEELRIAMFCVGAGSVDQLKRTESLKRICYQTGGMHTPKSMSCDD